MNSTPNTGARPTQNSIKQNLPDGNSPMDILNAIVNRPSPSEMPSYAANVVEEVMEKRAEESRAVETPTPPAPAPTPPVVEPEVPSQEETPEREEIIKGLLDKGDTTENNFKNLRASNKKTKDELEDLRKKYEDSESELNQYRNGEKIPDHVFEKEQRIAELEHFQELHSLKTSKAYKEKFIKPVQEVRARLTEIANEYELPEEVLDQALSIQSGKDLSRFLGDHFEAIDAIEVKKLITDVHGLSKKALDAEIDSGKMLRELEEESEKIIHEEETRRRGRISEKARSAWVDSLLEIRKEGKALEFIPKADDPEYNAKYVDPIQKQASTQFGMIVARLGELGLTDLPDDLAKALAKMTQLAHASANAMETRDSALAEQHEILTTSRRTQGYIRPPVGGSFAPGTGTPTVKPETREDRMESLLNAGRNSVRK